MKINTRCTNAILLHIQNHLEFVNQEYDNKPIDIFNLKLITFSEIFDAFINEYSIGDIKYSLIKLKEVSLIKCNKDSNNSIDINDGVKDITIEGHRYLRRLEQDINTNIINF